MAEVPVPLVYRAGLGHNFDNAEIPADLAWNSRCRNYDEYKTFITTIYNTLRVRQGGENIELVASSYCNLSQAQMRDTIRVLPGFGDARATPTWLFRILAMVKQPPAALTRHNLQELVGLLQKDNVNTKLKDIFGVAADRQDNDLLPLEYVQRWIISALDGIVYIHQKTRLGFEFNSLFDKYNTMVINLTTRVDEMLLNLYDRNAVNNLATETGKVRQYLIEACETYVKLDNPERKANVKLALQEFRNIENFNFTNFRTINQNNTLWLNHFSHPNPDTFDALSVTEIKDAVGKLTPLVKEIRSYTPSAVDLAKDKAARVKLALINLTRDLDEFLDSSNKGLAKAKSLQTTLTFYKEKCENLRVDGVPFDVENMAVTPQKMADYHEALFNYISDAEQEVKKKEHRDRLEASEILKTSPSISLPKLRGIKDWLNWKAALEKIMPFHSSEIVKQTLVKQSLVDKADQSRCQNLSYDSMYDYLSNRYDDSSLLPRLVDRLLTLRTAKDNNTSYQNLTEFLSVHAQLELHNGLDRVDSFVREKLVTLLLPNNLQCDFLANQIKQEREWKSENSGDVDDGASISTTFSVAQGEEFEERRRKFFVSSMKVYLEIMRKVATTNGGETTSSTPVKKKNPKKNKIGMNTISHQSRLCPACSAPHHNLDGDQVQTMSACRKFKAMPIEDRYKLCVNNNICKRCLASTSDGNHSNGCKVSKMSNQQCSKCNSKTHHELLCLPDKKTKGENRNKPQKKKRGKSSPKGSKINGKPNSSQTHYVFDTPRTTRADAMTPRTINAIRMFLSACSYVTVDLPGNQLSIILALLDIGAGLNLCLTSTAERLGLRQIKSWQGTISTINGETHGVFPVFMLPIKDVSGNIHRIGAIGVPHIGYKTPVPTDLFAKICQNMNIHPNIVQNTEGEIECLIGLESRILLAKQSNLYNNIPTTPDYPGVAVYESIVSPNYMLIGALGPSLAEDIDIATRMYNVSVTGCYYSHMVEDDEFSDPPSDMHNHELNNSTSFYQHTSDSHINNIRMPNVVTLQNMDEEQIDKPIPVMALLDIKKTAATLSHLDAAPLPSLVCPACKLIVDKCNSCKYLNAEASIKDLEELAIIKANLKKIEDPENPDKFYIFFDYVFRDDPKVIYAPQHTNKYLGQKSALRLRKRLLSENLMDKFHAEMLKSLNREHFAEVTGDLKKKFDKLGVENYINFNFVLKSTSLSQACRPVSDSTAYHKNGDLNSKLLAGIQSINNPLHIVWKFLQGPIAWLSDFSRAYRSVITSDIANAVRRFYWFSDPYNENTLTEYCLIRLNYGDSPSSAVLEEAIRSHIAPECKLEMASHILSWFRYVDDTLYSFQDLEEMKAVQEDIIQASEKANFLVKHTIFSGSTQIDEDGNDFTNVLGFQWKYRDDLLVCNIHFCTFPKKRGKPTGINLTIEIAMTTPLTKTITCRLSGQSFSYSQSQLLPITMALRIMFSKVSTLTKEWNEDVASVDEEFTQLARKTLASLADVHQKILPVERAVCPQGYKPWRVCISSDGSSQAAAACIHVVVTKDDGSSRVTNVAARGKIIKDTVPMAELIGANIAVSMMQEYIIAMDCFGKVPLEVILLTDSLCLCSSLNPQKLYKSVKIRNTCFAIHKTISDLFTRYPNLVIKYVHVKGSSNPSDYATKHVADPVSLVNGEAWRYGAPFYTDQKWPPDEIVFLQGDVKNQLQFKQPVAQQHVEQLDINCMVCHNIRDFCGKANNYCKDCHGSDNRCANASFHLDKDAQPPSSNEEFPVTDEDKDDYQGILDYDTYIRIIINCRSLIKSIHVVCILLHLANLIRMKRDKVAITLTKVPRPNHTMLNKAWRVIVRSSQKYFPPRNITMWFPYLDINGLLKARTRFMHKEHPDHVISMTSPPIISYKDHRLITLIIRRAHIKFVSPQLYNLHLQKNITMANIRSSMFPVEITRMSACVKKFINNCTQCLKMTAEPIAAALGTPRWYKCLQSNALPFRVISVDPIGDFLYVTPNTRGPPRKCYVLVVSCVLTTAISCYIMTGLTKNDVYLALYHHSQRYVEPRILYSDAGSNVRLTREDEGWDMYFGNADIEVINCGTEEYFANFCESKIKILKKLLKSSRLSRTANKLPNMTIPQLNSVFETFSNLLNSRAIFASNDGEFILTPNHIIKNWVSVENLSEDTLGGQLDGHVDKLEDQLNKLCKALRVGAKMFMENLKYTYLSDTRNYKTLQQQTTTPRTGDVVMVSRRDCLPLGIVEHTKNQFCWVRRKKNNIMVTERINFRKLYILHRPYTHQEPPASRSHVYQIRRSRGVIQTWVEKSKENINVVIDHPFSDVVFNRSDLYYFIDEQGRTFIAYDNE